MRILKILNTVLPDVINLHGVAAGGHAHTGAAGVKLDVLPEALGEVEGVQGLGLTALGRAPDLDSLVIGAAGEVAAIGRPAGAPDPVSVLGEAAHKLGPLHAPQPH